MAANCARRTLLISSASAKALLSRSSSSSSPLAAKASKLTVGLAVQKRVLSRFRFCHFLYPFDSSLESEMYNAIRLVSVKMMKRVDFVFLFRFFI